MEIEELVRNAQNGKVEAFEQLVKLHEKKIFNIIYRMVNDYDAALDLTQDSMLKAYEHLNSFNNKSSFYTWIYRISINTCLDYIKKTKKIVSISLEQKIKLSNQDEVEFEIEDARSNIEQCVENNQLKAAINRAVKTLNNDYKTVIVLRDIQGFSYDEIAEILKLPVGTVKSRINRGREILKNMLRKDLELCDDKSV